MKYLKQHKGQMGEHSIVSICEDDNREEIQEVNIESDVLKRGTRHLAITFEDDYLAAATGFFVESGKVVTACLVSWI